MNDNWLIWAMLSALLAAATAILGKLGLRGVDPDAAQFVRTFVVLIAVGILVTVGGRWRATAEFSSKTWSYLTLAGLATAGSWVCYFRALAGGDASRVAAVDKLSVPIVALVATFLLGERLGMLGTLGIVLAGVGIVLVSLAK